MRNSRRLLLRLLSAALAVGPLAERAEAQATAADEGWRFQLTPYFWAAGVAGTVGIRRLPSLEVDASFSDIIDKFDIGFLGRFEGRKSRWGFATDIVYLNLGAPLAGEQPIILILEPPVDVRQVLGEGTFFYRLASDASDRERAYVDAFVGGRYVKLRTQIGLVGGSVRENSVDWLDAILGLRGRAPLGGKAALFARGDIGGFGSKFAWNVEAGLAFQLSSSISLGAGYRYLHDDYEQGEGADRVSADIGFGGPGIFAAFSF